jgi:hypothetical protein
MTTESIINACCSVDDLRCHLRLMNPTTDEEKKSLADALANAAFHEIHKGRCRSTIVKMLHAKHKKVSIFCTVGNCTNPVHRIGLCKKHYDLPHFQSLD